MSQAIQRCPVCSTSGVAMFAVARADVMRCPDCTHQWYGGVIAADHVEREYADSYFSNGGVGYDDYLSEETLITEHGERYARLSGVSRLIQQAEAEAKTPSLLDVGCAAGFVMNGFARHGWRTWGLDPNASMVSRVQLPALAGKACIDSPLAVQALSKLAPPAGGFELVTMIQVAGHLTDLGQTLENLGKVLAPGGKVLVETWNARSYTARWLGRHWHEYSPPNVLHYFSPASLDTLMLRADFRRVDGGRPTKRINVGHARSLLGHKLGAGLPGKAFSVLSAPLPANWQLPYPAEDLFWALYQREEALC